MTPVLTLPELLTLPWSANMRDRLRAAAADPTVEVIAVYPQGDGYSPVLFRDGTPPRPGAVALWRPEPPAPPAPEAPASTGSPSTVKSRTMQALDLILSQGLTPYAAAQAAGISPAAVYRALARQEGRDKCPCCGQLVRDGYTVDRSVLKDPGADSGAA